MSAYLYAWDIAIAVIFTLNVIEIDIGGIEITLADALTEFIIAISFVLGFYNEESRKLLDKIRGKLSPVMEGEDKE